MARAMLLLMHGPGRAEGAGRDIFLEAGHHRGQPLRMSSFVTWWSLKVLAHLARNTA
jgi:hypothetical protein